MVMMIITLRHKPRQETKIALRCRFNLIISIHIDWLWPAFGLRSFGILFHMAPPILIHRIDEQKRPYLSNNRSGVCG